ncbi:carbon-nitrogen hydrolase family protein [Eubacterium sp. AB3007]|uniref:carbon-nitrogen hydrolase family protein n=1 Tax=Eubacterium sp. AB3007 TaxID=1392487 RepID=UPI00068AE42C|nr:carbon-nitrogen hydrolase family protein [Eubacterium sp. AB3007]
MIDYDIRVRVATTQMEPVWYNAHETITKMIQMIREAASNGAQLVAFGECMIPGYMYHVWTERMWDGHSKYDLLLMQNSLELDGPEMRRLMQAAKDNSIYVVTGYIERDGGSRYMSEVVISDEGRILMNRRKLKPTDAERCVCGDGTGADLKVVKTPLGIIGTTECWEHVQPLITYAMSSMHEQIHIAAWPGNRFNSLYYLTQAYGNVIDFSRVYAMQTQTFVLMAMPLVGQDCLDYFCGNDPDKLKVMSKGGGLAQIISPSGDFLCQWLPDDQDGIVYADIDLNEILQAKAMVDPVGQYSRPDIFCLHINKGDNPHTVVTGNPSADLAVERANHAFENDNGNPVEREGQVGQSDLLKVSPGQWNHK